MSPPRYNHTAEFQAALMRCFFAGVPGRKSRQSRFKIKSRRERYEVRDDVVDLKGIEPSNLTDANRALSQLSYKPICN